MSGDVSRSMNYDGRTPYRNTGGAPKPKRFDEMTAAAAAGDTNLFEALKASYLRDEAGER